MKLLFPAMLLAAGLASASPEPPLPSWDADEKKAMIAGGWFAGETFLSCANPSPEEATSIEPLAIAGPTAEELGTKPEDEQDIAVEYLADYFSEKPVLHLVDPQDLLSDQERKDIVALLDRHAADSTIDIYLYLFGAAQQIPGDVREEEIAERLYSDGKPAVVVNYFLGAPKRTTVSLSPVITDKVSAAELRRALESSVIDALGSTKPLGQIEAFLAQMSVRTYWMERMAAGTAEETMDDFPEDAAPVAVAKQEEPEKKRFHLPEWASRAAVPAAAGFAGLLLLFGLVMWLRARARYRFPEFEVEPRLGGSHAAGIGAVISFASPAIPPAMQRKQVPGYMRRA